MEIRHTKGMQFVASRRGHQIVIDQPVSAGGLDQGMTPPEVFASSLGACIGVYIVDFCDRHQIPTDDLVIRMSWEKASDLPNRIGEIKADVSLPVEIPDNMRQAIHRVAEQCLIHNTISNSPHVQINIESR